MAKRVIKFDDLIDNIQEDFAWRRKELKLIFDSIGGKQSPIQSAMLRSATTVLYAHWEGFAKNCCEYYLQYVSSKFLKHSDLKSQFIALSLTKKLNILEIRNIEEKTKAVDFVIQELSSNSNIPIKNVIQTKSNLRFSVFEEMLFILDLKVSTFQQYESLIDDLVDARNNIAHGTFLRVDYDTYVQFYNDVLIVMGILKTEIENSALLEKYKREAATA